MSRGAVSAVSLGGAKPCCCCREGEAALPLADVAPSDGLLSCESSASLLDLRAATASRRRCRSASVIVFCEGEAADDVDASSAADARSPSMAAPSVPRPRLALAERREAAGPPSGWREFRSWRRFFGRGREGEKNEVDGEKSFLSVSRSLSSPGSRSPRPRRAAPPSRSRASSRRLFRLVEWRGRRRRMRTKKKEHRAPRRPLLSPLSSLVLAPHRSKRTGHVAVGLL